MNVVYPFFSGRTWEDSDSVILAFICPGCKQDHHVRAKGMMTWGWNGDYLRPTFTPSILVDAHRPATRCHSFVENGRIRFLDDCWHELKNQVVDLPPYPVDA